MLESAILLLFCLLLGLASLVIVVWVAVSDRLFYLDGLMLTAICLTIGGIFLGNFVWSVRSGEFRQAMNRLLKKSEKSNEPSESKAE